MRNKHDTSLILEWLKHEGWGDDSVGKGTAISMAAIPWYKISITLNTLTIPNSYIAVEKVKEKVSFIIDSTKCLHINLIRKWKDCPMKTSKPRRKGLKGTLADWKTSQVHALTKLTWKRWSKFSVISTHVHLTFFIDIEKVILKFLNISWRAEPILI